jgi:hypothetical protein
MFGLFRKKNLDDNIIFGIVNELAMFLCWYEDTYKKMLPLDVATQIASRIFQREGLSEAASIIPGLAYATDRKISNALRLKTNFDANVNGFLNSISYSMSDVSSW